MATGRLQIFVVMVLCLLLGSCDDGQADRDATADFEPSGAVDQETERTWLLPAGYDKSEDPGFPFEFGPNFWPSKSTLSVWRSGEDWILIHTQPKDAESVFPHPIRG